MARVLQLLVVFMTMSVAFAAHAQRKPGATKPPGGPSRGWSNRQAFDLAKEGIDAHQKGDEVLCVARDQASVTVEATRSAAGETYSFRETYTLAEGENKRVEVLLTKQALTPEELECLRRATTYEEKLACIEHKSTKPNVHIGVDLSGYTDSLN